MGRGFFCAVLASLLSLAPCHAQTVSTTTLVPALGWDVKKQGGFPVSLASDAAGNIWVGTEGNGLWKYDAAKKEWTQFTTRDGLGDDTVYALAFDHLNRLWAGHLNHGVSVYNGDKWKNYGLLDGPIGDRVFAIAISPKDGSVWMATDMGIARYSHYSEDRQDWDYYTRASGLPSDQIQSIAFDGKGQIYAGTQCNGIAIAGPDDNYTKWRVVTAPPSTPEAPGGAGLPSNSMNNVDPVTLDEHDPLIMALTQLGTAVTSDGSHWWFSRGPDWRDYPPGPYSNINAAVAAPLPDKDLGFAVANVASAQPAEDWATALGSEGWRHWVGYRKLGVESYEVDENGKQKLESQANVTNGTVFIRAILAIPNQSVLIAAYDADAGGLLTLANAHPYNPANTGVAYFPNLQSPSSNPHPSPPPLPATVPPPALDDAKILAAPLGKLTNQFAPGEAYYLADDWRTEGDWVGRYGSGYVKLCGMARNGDQDYPLQPGYEVSLQVGPNHKENAASPVSYHVDETSDDLRSLYDPTLGNRRDAGEDDSSDDLKTYPESYDGPDLRVRVTVPDGVHCLSLYFLNGEAHSSSDAKYRDYDIQVLPGDVDDSKAQANNPLNLPNIPSATSVDDGTVRSVKPLSRARVTDFWGGVYKQFLICGPASYVVRIGRNRSFGTRLQAVFLDPVTVAPTDTPSQLPGFDAIPYHAPDEPDEFHPTPLAQAAVTLWGQLDEGLALRGGIPLQMPLRIWCYRAAVAGMAPAVILERWRWQISIWTPDDRKKFDDAMKAAHDAIK